MTATRRLRQLHDAGGSVWLDDLLEIAGVEAFSRAYDEVLDTLRERAQATATGAPR